MKYWLFKSEPDAFGIDNLKKQKKSMWDGVRNYQARNFMMKEMSKGDQVLFYHSNAKTIGIAGLAEVSKDAEPDVTAFDKKSDYFDSKSTKENPRWHCVEVKFKEKFKEVITLAELKEMKALKDMLILRKGNRLSITPVLKKEYDYIVKVASRQ